MRYTIEKHERYVIVEPLRDKIDAEAAVFLKGEFMLRNTSGQRNIVLDLSHVKEISEEGIRMGLLAHRLCLSSGGMFILTGIDEHVGDTLKLVHLDKYFTIVKNITEAEDLIFGNELQQDLMEERD
jgi:anti-sigma B factor antagonist